MHSPQNDWLDIKINSSRVESLASCGKKKSFANRKRGSWDYIRRLKVPPLYLRSTLPSTNRPQATTHHFWLKKGLHTANRLQRWDTILLNCNFKIEYQPLKNFGHADGLSRLIPKYKEPLEETVIASLQSEDELKTTLCNTVKERPVTLEQIKQEAPHKEYINKMNANTFEKDQRSMDVFSIFDEVLLYRERIVIPSTLQKRILNDFHAGHPGSTRMKSLMRSYVNWPNMDKDIENAIKSCKGCALAAKAPPIKFNPWLKTDLLWSRIPTDPLPPRKDITTSL